MANVDYIWRGQGGGAQYIDCDPRLVGPMNAYLAGLDLVELLLQISSGKSLAATLRSPRVWACNPCWVAPCAGTLSARSVQLIEREVVA
jgi:hypothetical protein